MALDTQACQWYYGDPNSQSFKEKHLTLYVFPEWMAAIFPAYQVTTKVRKQWINKDQIPALEAVFKELLSTGLYKELKTFDGLLNIRKKRTNDEYSIHSWGLAEDFNAKTNPLGGKVTFSQAFLNVWKKHGFVCGSDFPTKDGMHFQWDKTAKDAYAKHLAQKIVAKPTPKPTTKK